MPKLRDNEVPRRRHHKASGQDVVTLSGRDRYLGPHDSPEAIAKYRELTSRWLANGGKLPVEYTSAITVREVCDRFMHHAATYYLKRGRPTSEVAAYQRLADRACKLYGSTDAPDFGPIALKLVRETWVADGCARRTCNRYANGVVRIFRWAASEEIIPGSLVHSLSTLKPLEAFRTPAREIPEVEAAPLASIEAVIAAAIPVVATMMRVQLLTAMRPGEVCGIVPGDIDRSGPVWIYRPGSHKTEHRGRSRAIPIGPLAQELLRSWVAIAPGPDAPLFSTMKRRDKPYRVATFGIMINAYCDRLGIARFTPNQIRHSGLTEIRTSHGLEAARVIAGHADASTTTIYAKLDERKIAEDVAAQRG